MHFYVTLTTQCDLQCRYCYGKAFDDLGTTLDHLKIDYNLPPEIRYSVEDLQKFIVHDSSPTLIFYGGEPLLRPEAITRIMDSIDARYIIQTNGLHLPELEQKYINRFHTILVSIDGDEELTDFYRGQGVYRRVIENVKDIRTNGYSGEIIARMTVMEKTNIDQQVWHLLFNTDNSFTSVHWQLDALFWKNDFIKRPFANWIQHTYLPQIRQLIENWINYIEKYHIVQKIYPLIGIVHSLLTNEDSRLRCGAGWSTYNIQTDGNISPCPVMAGIVDYYVGDIWRSSPLTLDEIHPSSPCTLCSLNDVCGGRCLYANFTKLWGEEGFRLVCTTVSYLIENLRIQVPKLQHFIKEGFVQLNDFHYTKYNSCEIIP